MGKKGGSDGSAEVKAARSDEQARQERIRKGTKSISDMFDGQFTPAYFEKQAANYRNYAMPQLQDQHKDAAKQLVFALDRRGALDSSSRASQEAELERKRALEETAIKDRARDYSTTARANIEGARGDLISTLNATGDAEGAVRSANARAQVLSAVPGYSPLASMFDSFTAGLGMQAAAEKAFSYGGGPKPALGVTGLFGTPRGAVDNRG